MMNNTWKKALSVLIAVALTLSFAACAGKGANNASAANASASDAGYSAKELAKTAVKVGDDYLITKGDVIKGYNAMVQAYVSYGMSAPTDEAEIESMQDSVIDSIVSAKIQLYQAEKLGITLSDEKKADVDSQIEEMMAYYTDMFRTRAQEEGASDVEARALEIFQQEIDAAGMEMSVDGYRTYMLEGLTEEALTKALKAEVTKDATATDDDIQSYFNDLLASQKESYTAAPADFGSAAEGFQISGGDPMLYTPEGYVRVRSISIAPSGEISADYTALQEELIALEAQYGAAALSALADQYAAAGASAGDTGINVTVSDIEGGAEIVSDYLTKKAAADALYENYTKEAREKANEAFAALEAGTSFAEVLAQYGEDTVYTEYPAFVETGLLMYVGGDDISWNEELVKAVGLLKDGEYSAVILADDVYYIVQLVGSEPAGEKTLTDVYDTVKAAVVSLNADTAWNTQLEAWLSDKDIVTYYEKVYRDIGKN